MASTVVARVKYIARPKNGSRHVVTPRAGVRPHRKMQTGLTTSSCAHLKIKYAIVSQNRAQKRMNMAELIWKDKKEPPQNQPTSPPTRRAFRTLEMFNTQL